MEMNKTLGFFLLDGLPAQTGNIKARPLMPAALRKSRRGMGFMVISEVSQCNESAKTPFCSWMNTDNMTRANQTALLFIIF